MSTPQPQPPRQPHNNGPVVVPPIPPTYKDTNHTLHLILSLVTFGCWFFVWPFVHLANSAENRQRRTRYEQQLRVYAQAQAQWSGQ